MKTITAKEFHKKKQDSSCDCLVVNTLPADKFQQTKIDGSVNIPGDQPNFAQQVEQKAGGKDKEVVVYCASSDCDSSTEAAKKLEAAGFKHVVDFEGGYKAYEAELQPAH